jgi:phosphonoacetaldehyde hydrolase
VGVTLTGNELGLSGEEVAALAPAELAQRLGEIEDSFRAAGAHFVIESAADLEPAIDRIDALLRQGRTPLFPGPPEDEGRAPVRR